MYAHKEYKIKDLVDPEYDGLNVNLIDFKRCLTPEVSLNKTTTKDNKGRPYKSEYSYEGELLAVIYYIFTTDESNLVTSRKEILRYILNDGTEGSDIVIKCKTYYMTNSSDIEAVIKEREIARSSVVTELKGFISGVMRAHLNWSMDQVVANGKPFWSENFTEMKNFIEFGSNEWRENLTRLNLDLTPYFWLKLPVNESGLTLRDYVVSRLTY